MKRIYSLLVLLVALTVSAWAAEPEILTPYELVSKKRVGRTVMEYTFQARLRGGDQPLHNVRATATSNSPATAVIEGEVTFGDVDAGATVLSRDTFTVRQDRRQGNFSPASLRWQVQYDPQAGFTISGRLTPMPEALRVGLVEPQPLVHQLTLLGMTDPKHLSNQPLHVQISQTVRPDPAALQLQPSLTGRQLASDHGILRDFLKQRVLGLKPGRYTLVTTVTVEETGETVRDEVTIEVVEGAETLPGFKQLYFIPYALPAGRVTETEIQLEIANVRREAIESVRAYTTDGRYEATLVNDSPQAGGFLYRGRLDIDATSMRPDQCLTFEAEVVVRGRSHITSPANLCVTGLPTDASPGRRGSFSGVLVQDPEGTDYPADKLFVTVVAGTSETRVREIAQSIGAEVYENEGWGDYIFRLLTPARSYQELKDLADRLKTLSEVEDAFPSSIVWHASGLIAPITNDPFLAEQSQLRTSRVDEAWYVVTGRRPVAVIDHGIGLDHPEFAGKIAVARTTAGEFAEAIDVNAGHGTFVAGVIAAVAGNHEGIAGIAWDSPLYVYKPYSKQDGFQPDYIKKAIRQALEHPKVRILNISLGSTKLDWKNKICKEIALQGLHKQFVVTVSAGNDGQAPATYPANCPQDSVIGVGGVYPAVSGPPEVWEDSNWGVGVDLAAQAVDVFSTTGGAYTIWNGTSFAAPQVAGTAALLWERHPDWPAHRLMRRLIETSGPVAFDAAACLSSISPVGSALDAFEAVFNGDFEVAEQHRPWLAGEWEWDGVTAQNCWRAETLYGIAPASGRAMLACTTAGSAVAAGMWNRLEIPAGVTELPVTFDWKLVTEEFTSYRGTGYTAYNDGLIAELVKVDEEGRVVGHGSVRFERHINQVMLGEEWDPGDDELFPTRHASFRQSNWHTDTVVFPVEYGAGRYYLRFYVEDVWDANGVTYVLIDRVRLRAM